jgi:hypothetical protein
MTRADLWIGRILIGVACIMGPVIVLGVLTAGALEMAVSRLVVANHSTQPQRVVLTASGRRVIWQGTAPPHTTLYRFVSARGGKTLVVRCAGDHRAQPPEFGYLDSNDYDLHVDVTRCPYGATADVKFINIFTPWTWARARR